MAQFAFFVGLLLLFAQCSEAGTFAMTTTETDPGCNATLLCLHQPVRADSTANIVWVNSSSGQILTGSRFRVESYSSFSTLTILSTTSRDSGSFTCVTPEANVTLLLNVRAIPECTDVDESNCKLTVEQEGLQLCNGTWMMKNCRSSCGLCPKTNCSETELPTISVQPAGSTIRPSTSWQGPTSRAQTVQHNKSLMIWVFFLGCSSIVNIAI